MPSIIGYGQEFGVSSGLSGVNCQRVWGIFPHHPHHVRSSIISLPPSGRQAVFTVPIGQTKSPQHCTAPVVFLDLNLISRRACYLPPFTPHVLARHGQSEHPSLPLSWKTGGLFVPEFFHACVRPVSSCCRVHIYAPCSAELCHQFANPGGWVGLCHEAQGENETP